MLRDMSVLFISIPGTILYCSAIICAVLHLQTEKNGCCLKLFTFQKRKKHNSVGMAIFIKYFVVKEQRSRDQKSKRKH